METTTTKFGTLNFPPKIKPTFIIQLCCYADMLASIQGIRPAGLCLALGEDQIVGVNTCDFWYYYQALKTDFLAMHHQWQSADQPDPAMSSNWGSWSGAAEVALIAQDHLFQVARITKGQIKKLHKASIQTLKQLAQTPQDSIVGLADGVFHHLKAQAHIQSETKTRCQASPQSPPCFKALKPEPGVVSGFALLPPHSDQDIFFDIEGFPLEAGGLEYLWGASFFDDQGQRCFKDFWAHTPKEEQAAF